MKDLRLDLVDVENGAEWRWRTRVAELSPETVAKNTDIHIERQTKTERQTYHQMVVSWSNQGAVVSVQWSVSSRTTDHQ